jgi:Helicase conserved C-terminal domain/Mitochondrial degradasome RNA helicase subunit C terminal
MIRTILGWFRKSPKGANDFNARPQSLIKEFLNRHKAIIKSLQLEADASGFIVRDERKYQNRGVTTTVLAVETSLFLKNDLGNPKYKSPEMSLALLTKIRGDLTFQAKFSLDQAVSAIDALSELVLRPNELRWLGDEAAAREAYLKLPEFVLAADATATARKHYKDAQACLVRARNKFLEVRVRKLSSAKINGKMLQCMYLEAIPLLSSSLEVELTIEKTLEHRESEALVSASDDAFSTTLDNVLKNTRKALVARVVAQLAELTKDIGHLPHIELLTDDEIAATVAPYYGGLNRSLKKRRAKSAIVAVEERAREAKYQGDVLKLNEQRAEYADVAGYYPMARSMKRELILYVGPTNSGKTWHALNELAATESGVYLAPLRLLALEGQEELEKRGKPTSFVTGEERDLRDDAKFVSSTIEMLNLEYPVDAVVVDEVQMLADERRGWAWLAAVLGAPAGKIIMTGSPDCVDLVKGLADYLGEKLTVHELQRHNELRVAPAPIRLREIRKGMAIVCFSRRDVMRIKTTIQENSELKVAVVYGNLSPQVRREEARRFRTGEADILVATDAIAMGLNLPISEVLFYTTEKFNGEQVVPLTHSEIRQIGGRAGRFGFAQFGVVHALNSESLELIREAIGGQSEVLKPPYYVAPGPNHIRIISQVLGTTSLERILTFFERAIEFSDERFARSNIDELSYLSTFVDERLPYLEVTQRLKVACAPVAIRNETVLNWFLNRMLPALPNPAEPEAVHDDLDDLFDAARPFEAGVARGQLDLRDAEDYLKTLTIYAWLAYRYPDVFTRIEDCENRREAVNAFVERSLRRMPGKVVQTESKNKTDGGDRGSRGHRGNRGGSGRRKR